MTRFRALRQTEEQLRADVDDLREWYITGQGQTFMILDAGEFLMGSPESERDRTADEYQFACRARAGTSRFYGQSDTLLPRYARYQANAEIHAWPVASLKPTTLDCLTCRATPDTA